MSEKPSREVVLRSARHDEAEALLRLWQQADATPSVTDNAAAVERMLGNTTARVVVATNGGQLVGSIIAAFDGWRGHIYRLAVHPDYRRRGIARALLTEADVWLAAQGARRVVAMVESDHPLAVGFWSASGYQSSPHIVRFTRNL
jgi:ribosomal protein S18 acetylase RimI-like enzyme